MTAPSPATVPSAALTPATVVARALAWRNLAAIPRVPATFIPSLVFPLFNVVAFSGAFSAVARLPGFPAEKMIDWILPMAVVQGCAFSGVAAGFGMVRDLESGFFDRLLVAPVRPVALVAGPVLAAVVRSLVPFVIVLVAGLLAGVDTPGGVAGLAVLLGASLGVSLLAAFWSIGLALRFRSMRAAPLVQVGIFLSIFLSTAQVPLSVMTGWLHGVARVNPMTNVLRLGRQGFIGAVAWDQSWGGLLALALGSLVLGAFAVRGLRAVER